MSETDYMENLSEKKLNTRLFVIEKAILLEQLVSMTIADLLHIKDWEESKMLGLNSTAFSFNQKLTFFLDLKELPKELNNKFRVLLEIRNKFAHTLKVYNFQSYRDFDSNSSSNCKKLSEWYIHKIQEETLSEDEKFLLFFGELFGELAEYTINLSIDFECEMGYSEGKKSFLKEYTKELENILIQMPNGEELRQKVLEKLGNRK